MNQCHLPGLAEAMDWVIPPDSSLGAGSPECVARMLDLVEAEGMSDLLATHLPGLTKSDLADSRNAFAQRFIEMVRDVYYAYPETGSWADIGFRVKEP